MLIGGAIMLLICERGREWSELTFTPLYVRGGSVSCGDRVVGRIYGIYLRPEIRAGFGRSQYAYADPVIAVLPGALLLAEPFGPRVIMTTVLLGITVVR